MLNYRNLKKIFSQKQYSWKEIEYFDSKWKQRIAVMAELIPIQSKSVLDLGCGKMWLNLFLPEEIEYIPVDYTDRGSGTIICDFNNGEFPTNQVDTAFVSGCLEYIHDYQEFIQFITKQTQYCVLSYCSTNFISSRRRRFKQNWVNDLSEEDIIKLFEAQAFSLHHLISQENSIFLFKKENTPL